MLFMVLLLHVVLLGFLLGVLVSGHAWLVWLALLAHALKGFLLSSISDC
jgi:hypothetical protein